MRRPITVVWLLAAMLPGWANAALIFAEDFSVASGSAPLGGGFDFGSTEREGGQYYSGVTLPGWTLNSPSSTFLHVGSSGNRSVLLNEGGGTSIGRTVAGLQSGVVHRITFEYWGDNSASPYSFRYEINGATVPLSASSTGLRTGNFHTVTLLFIPVAASSLLRFAELTGQGVVLDNIQISTTVPEPGTIALAALGLLGIGAARRKAPLLRQPSSGRASIERMFRRRTKLV